MRVRSLVGILILMVGIVGLLIWAIFRQGVLQPDDRFSQDLFEQARDQMVEDTIERRGVKDPAVLRAMRNVPRHEFVPQNILIRHTTTIPSPLVMGRPYRNLIS